MEVGKAVAFAKVTPWNADRAPPYLTRQLLISWIGNIFIGCTRSRRDGDTDSLYWFRPLSRGNTLCPVEMYWICVQVRGSTME